MPDPLRMVTIYDHPRDYPLHWVARAYTITAGAGPVAGELRLAGSLDEARDLVEELVPTADTCLPRQAGEDPTIVETWL